jgi:GAF domain-containing protein
VATIPLSGIDLEAENRRLRALLQFGRAATSERELRPLLALVCEQLASSIGWSAALVALRDPEQGRLELVEAVGLPSDAVEAWQRVAGASNPSPSAGRTELGEAVRLREASVHPELATDPHLSDVRDILLGAGLRRALSVPLVSADGVLGVGVAYDTQAGEVADHDVDTCVALAEQATIAIRNARLHADTRRELRRRDGLRTVVAAISSELDLDSLLARVVGGAVELLDAYSGTISLVDRAGIARVRAVYNLPNRFVGRFLGPGAGIIGQVVATRAPVVVENYTRDLPGPLPEFHHVRSAIGVPVWWQGQVTGVFAVFADEPNRLFDEHDREAMELLANHVAIAIENARLYGEVRDRLADLTRLQAASSALVEELQPERALLVVAQQALALSAAESVSIELLRESGTELEVQVAVGEHAHALAGMRVAVEGSLSGSAVASGRPQIARAPFEGAPRQADAAVERTNARSLLVLPLRARGRTLGTLTAYTGQPDAFQPRHVDLLATFANQAAMTLDNARLYGELHSRLEEMVGLQRLGTLLLEEHDFDRVLHAICRQLQRLTDAGGVGLALLEDDPNYLELRTVVGPSAAVLRGSRIPIAGSFAGEAIRTNRPQRSDDAQHDERGYRRNLTLGNIRTLLSVPMKTRQRTIGVLSIYNKQGPGGFTERDSELATFFANQAAAAIENARLYEATREYTVIEERNRLARELHDSVTQSLFSVTLLSQAALSLWDRDLAKARERVERAHEVAQGALAEMRALIFQLRPMALQEEGLVSALEKHLAALHSRHNQVVELRVSGDKRRLSAGVEEAAFRIVQESLNNVVKHARASSARVELEFAPSCLRVRTSDNGVGFDPAGPRPRTMGVASMRERAEAMEGTVRIESRPGAGTRVVAELPLRDHEDGG